MVFIQNIFWNGEEQRIRSGYRLVLQMVMAISLSVIIGKISGVRFATNAEAPVWYFIYMGTVRLVTAFVSVWLAGRFLDKRMFADFGFHFNKKWWMDFAFGAMLGIFLMTAIFLFEYGAGWITIKEIFFVKPGSSSFIWPLLVFLFLFICVGINEELVSRGYLLTNFAEGLTFKSLGPRGGILMAWFITSGMFGLFHAGNPNATVVAVLNIALAGILLGTAYILTGRLAIPIGIHITWNFLQGPVFGFPVSGQSTSDVVTVFSIEQGGPEFWTGGAFGPEAGMLGLLAMIIGVLLILAWTHWREGKIQLYTPIALPPATKPKKPYEGD